MADLAKELKNTGLRGGELLGLLTSIDTTYNYTKRIVNSANEMGLSFDDLSKLMGGYNNDGELFDIAINDVVMTVNKTDNGYSLSDNFAVYVYADLQDGFTTADVLKAYTELKEVK